MDRHRQEEPGAGRPVDVEVLLLRRTDDGGLAYRVRRSPLHADDHPDLAALLLAGCCSPAVSHSTSWRAEDDTLVLTYAVVPDPDRAEPALPLPHPLVVWSGDPTRPSPKGLHLHHVAAHAVRHLAGLRVTDPGVRRAAADGDPIWDVIASFADTTVAVHELLPPDHD